MTHSYVAFIDESGDDGFKTYRTPGKHGGSSRWLVISACLFRRKYLLDAVAWRDEILARMPEKKGRTLHFAQLSHGQKVVASQVLADKPVRVMSVLSSKETIPEGVYNEKNQLYFYLTRYLIERLSWICRDLRPKVPEGDGRVAITFSRRGGMSYEGFREYLEKLKSDPDLDARISWPVIDINSVDAQDHSRSAALQLADIVASSFAAGLEPDLYGNCELRYAETLKPITYSRKGNFFSYGVKIVPPHENCVLNDQQKKMIEIWKV